MKKMKTKILGTLLLIFLLCQGASKSFALAYWNWDVTNNTSVSCDNFEVVLNGDVTSTITDYFVGSIVYHIPGWTAHWYYEAATGHTIVVFQGGNPIPPGTKVHYGIASSNPLAKLWVNVYWTSGIDTYKQVVMPSYKWNYDISSHVLNYTLINASDETIAIDHMGYKPYNGIQPLDQLNEVSMPSSLFTAVSIQDGTILPPGDSVTFQIHNISIAGNPGLSVVLYFSTRFVNPPPGANTSNMNCWAQGVVANAPIAPTAVPTLSQWGLIFFGIILLGVGVFTMHHTKSKSYT
jgi:hypothetical protein